MQLRQAAVIFLTSTVVLTQLSGCAAVAPDKGVENSDDVTVVTEETNANSTAANTDTVTVGGEQYDVSETLAEQVEQEEIPLTTEELHALFKKEYDSFKWAKENLGEYYKTDYLKLPAREIGTQTDANVYADIEAEVAKPEYEGKILPDDGFEQYVAWREALEKGSSSGNNQSGNNSGNTSNTGNTGGQTQQKPSTKPSGGSNNSSGGSSNNGGSSGGSQGGTSQNGDPTANIRNGSGATEIPGGSSIDDDYAPPSYEIVG